MNTIQSQRLSISGIVQGVGFRPFVYQIARELCLTGEVSNTSAGVTICLEGTTAALETFRRELEKRKPPLAQITRISVESCPQKGFTDFSIVKSSSDNQRSTLISPDVCVCDDCLTEMRDPADRRYGYPFINCTNCGPRYTIIDDVPYDRPFTSMRHFVMCEQCQGEYDDPMDRRFHAQPNACPVCGPKVSLLDADGKQIDCENPIAETADRIRDGRVVAIKGLGGFHLAVDAENKAAVSLLRQRKHREEKPFAVMAPDLSMIRTFAEIGEKEEKLLSSLQRPIVLLEKKLSNGIAEGVSPGNKYFGVMLPYTPLHYLLLDHGFTALVMTSGNISDEPICIDNDEAVKRLSGIADAFLVHNRDIYLRSDDSIVRHTVGHTRFIRRSRGYVPVPVFLRRSIPPVLALGAELKNTVCLTKEDRAFVSQHIGDLENMETYRFLDLTVSHLKRILDINPEVIACDMHPDYLSTRYALEECEFPPVRVQHHHAHIVSCMAENHVDGEVIGLAMDGTGYGSDGHIWGGEILVCRESGFSRAGHFSYVPMPGSAAAIREPWRMAVSYLLDAYGSELKNLDLPEVNFLSGAETSVLVQMIDKRLNTPMTSSIGRLFDGVAAILGLRRKVRFEGQAAMELEMISHAAWPQPAYEAGVDCEDGIYRILPKSIVRAVVADLKQKVPPEVIGARFHATVIDVLAHVCERVRKDTGITRVAMSGGSFQNAILLGELITGLEKRGFSVYTHQQVPTNDGGISLGQAVAAAAMVGKGALESKSED